MSREVLYTFRKSHNRVLEIFDKFNKEDLTIPIANLLGVAEEITEELLNKKHADDNPKTDLVDDRKRKKGIERLYVR